MESKRNSKNGSQDQHAESHLADGDTNRSEMQESLDSSARPNPGDTRRSNRADRKRSPEIDEHITGKELERDTLAALRSLDDVNNKWVSRHLVMASELIDDDPELAFEHTLAASRRGGRIGVVREAVGAAAYRAGFFDEALRELRTHRRMTGDDSYVALIADCERGVGRPHKALETYAEQDLSRLDPLVSIELMMVAAGAHADLNQFREGIELLEKAPGLRKDKAYSFSPRLFELYAYLLEHTDRASEATVWNQLAKKAQSALDKQVQGPQDPDEAGQEIYSAD